MLTAFLFLYSKADDFVFGVPTIIPDHYHNNNIINGLINYLIIPGYQCSTDSISDLIPIKGFWPISLRLLVIFEFSLLL